MENPFKNLTTNWEIKDNWKYKTKNKIKGLLKMNSWKHKRKINVYLKCQHKTKLTIYLYRAAFHIKCILKQVGCCITFSSDWIDLIRNSTLKNKERSFFLIRHRQSLEIGKNKIELFSSERNLQWIQDEPGLKIHGMRSLKFFQKKFVGGPWSCEKGPFQWPIFGFLLHQFHTLPLFSSESSRSSARIKRWQIN